jgi:large subunit ribosomal protein L32
MIRQHDKLTPPHLMNCPQCRQYKRQHHVCPHCGYYAGRQVLEIEVKQRRRDENA